MTTKRHQLIARRKSQGLSQETLADRVGVTPNTTYRWERGESEPSATQRRPLADALDVSLARLDRILRNEDGEDTDGDVGPLMPLWLSAYVGMEQVASRVDAFQPYVVHGLLQTADYARSILESSSYARRQGDRVERLVERRIARRASLVRDDDPLEFRVVLSEAALRARVGNARIMRDQLRHIAAVSEWPNVTLQVLAFDCGVFFESRGNFALLTFPWDLRSAPSTVYTETEPARATFTESAHEIDLYLSAFARLSSAALDAVESAEFVRRLAKEHTDA